jgi:hypothetical protein
MIGKDSVWRTVKEDDSLLVVECQTRLTDRQRQYLLDQFAASLEGTGKKVLLLEDGLKLATVDGEKLWLHAEQAGPGQPMRIFDQHGRTLEGLHSITVTDAVDDARVLHLDLHEMHGDGDYTLVSDAPGSEEAEESSP